MLSLAWNLLLVYVCYFICRLTFLLTNWSLFSEQFEWGYMCRLFGAGTISIRQPFFTVMLCLFFCSCFLSIGRNGKALPGDTVDICDCKYFFLLSNLVDCVYFRFSGRRTTTSVFQEFSHEAGGNLTSII